jgi:hypothetical protein
MLVKTSITAFIPLPQTTRVRYNILAVCVWCAKEDRKDYRCDTHTIQTRHHNGTVVCVRSYRSGSADRRGGNPAAPGVAAGGAQVPLVEILLRGEGAGGGRTVRRTRSTATKALQVRFNYPVNLNQKLIFAYNREYGPGGCCWEL